MTTRDNVVKLFEGDPRMLALLDAVSAVLHERGAGLPIPSILGVLDLAKEVVIADALDEA